jgi:hypothetical protein
MAESSTGYVSNFQVYTGREGGSSEKGLAHRIVMDLAGPYFGSHLYIFMDNFYSGVPLFEDLNAHGLNACGTVRSNRKGIPPKPPAMDKHRYQVSQKDELTFCAWQDTKVVLVRSNYHEPMAEGPVRRRRGEDIQREVRMPACVSDYQKHMKGGRSTGSDGKLLSVQAPFQEMVTEAFFIFPVSQLLQFLHCCKECWSLQGWLQRVAGGPCT